MGFLLLFMQKIIAFLNKHSIALNSVAIVFWLYIIVIDYLQLDAENSFEKKKNTFIIPTIFILVSVFNIYMAYRRKHQR